MNYNNLDVSIVAAFYFDQKSADSLYRMLDHYTRYSAEVRSKIQLVLVDDCSKIEVKIPNGIPLNYQLLRVKDDIMWNNGGARNLGVVHARTSKIVLTDIDHVFPEKLLGKIIDHRARKSTFYKFKRTDHEGNAIRTPRNLLYMTKGLFFDALGYDEEFCGNYGFEDSFFIDLLRLRGNSFKYFSRFSKVIENKVDRENSYHTFSRDVTINTELMNRKMKMLKKKEGLFAHSRLFLNFNWEKVEEHMNVMPLQQK